MKKTCVLTGIVLLILLMGCSRYDDGPWISFRTAKNRVVGTWQVEKLLINDQDSTELYREQIGCEWEFTDELFTEDLDNVYVINLKNCIVDSIYYGRWYFKDPTKVKLSVSTDTTNYPIGPIGRNGTWDILRLTNNEMNLFSTTWAGQWERQDEANYYLELKKL